MDQDVLYFFEGKPEALPLYAAFEEKVFQKWTAQRSKCRKRRSLFPTDIILLSFLSCRCGKRRSGRRFILW